MSLHLQQQAATSVHDTEAVDDTEEDLENVQAQRSRNRGNRKVHALSNLLIRS
jgi:hypothetical protein